ncbi:RNA polymerase I-specific transcription initiation factor RRN6 [Coccidioides immitis RS]|uniref:RNA polymerase I-specific transcription initiation factor RRN6 n=1 Tax=Coccidioides immitis (strain RS) TaxID=246410 RepID=A0A0D8JWM2_COCIM|nr:RNA polymerase I-specific transcription initiation factor RRN6 [Coccidioides immitis RS]KJF60673.1 RNA polymerase I-specific transcription initiation factor RRN6 [Coccidioides immitis RS]TPX24457.1 hypothetical protein DIZ76_013804 [Coccidioides immitis]
MDDHCRRTTLQYGHLGTPFYLPGTQNWEFTRVPKRSPAFTALRETFVTSLEPDSTFSSPTTQHEASRVARKEHSLLKAYPELAPSLGLVNSHDRSSQVITATVTNFDPLVSTRLAFGRAVNENHAGSQSVPIVVTASGDPATSIAVIPLDLKTKGTLAGSKQMPSSPNLAYSDGAWWKCPGGPVQQICFAESIDEENTYFAARFSQSTMIFRPLRHRMPLLSSFGVRGFMLEPHSKTHLNANPLVDIPISLTGGQPHADVTFNPWYQRQVAIIDRCGKWSVWDIRGKHQLQADWIADRGPCGSLSRASGLGISEPTKEDHFDGWAAVIWVGDVHQLLVCNRRNLALCRLSMQPPEQHLISLGLQRPSEWILDISRSKHNPSHFFVLTTTKVLWLNVLPVEASPDGHGVSTLLSWKHFRDTEDTSLRLAQVLVQNALYIIIFSHFNDLTEAFRFSLSAEGSSIPLSISDPFLLSTPWPTNGAEHPEDRQKSFCFSSMLFEEIDAPPGFSDEDSGSPTLIKFIGQRADLAIVEGLYSMALPFESPEASYPRLNSILPQRRRKLASLARVDDFDFVVDDVDEPVIQLEIGMKQNNSLHRSFRRDFQPHQRTEQWTSLHVRVITSASQPVPRQDEIEIQIQGFDDWIRLATSRLQDQIAHDSMPAVSQTLLEALGVPPALDAIDSNARNFARFIQTMSSPVLEPRHRRWLSGLPLPFSATSRLPVFTPTQQNDMSLAALYDSLVYDWLSPLSEHVPNRVRMSKERMIRCMVAEIMFSRISLVQMMPETRESTSLEDQVMTSSGPANEPPFKGGRRGASHDGILPSQGASFTPMLYQSHEPTARASLALHRYTTVNPQPDPLKRVMTTLSHWKVGTDPADYDWQKTVHAIQDEQSLSGDHPTVQRRRRREERKRRQLEKAQKQASLTPSTPKLVDGGRMWGSQPDRAIRMSPVEPELWSSQIKEENIPLTQVERGVFGSREVARKKMGKERRKRRAAGF